MLHCQIVWVNGICIGARGLSSLVFSEYWKEIVSRDNSLGIATHYAPDGPGNESQLEARFSSLVQTGPGVHPASYTTGTGSFPGGIAAAAGRQHHPCIIPQAVNTV